MFLFSRGLSAAAVGVIAMSWSGLLAERAHAQTPTPPPSAFSSGPSVSSMGPGRTTVFARSGGNLYSVDTTQTVGAGTTSSGWRLVPGGSDIVSDPDSAMDPWKQWVVGRRGADNDCYYATRNIVTSGTVYPAWSAWTRCMPTANTFDSGISVAIANHPTLPMSFVHFFARRGGTIYWSKATFYNNSLVATQNWLFLATGVDDGSLPPNGSPTDFVGDPDATVYAGGTKIAVCGQRANGQVYCTNFDPGPSPWHVMGPTKPGTGPGATQDVAAQGYEVYYDLTAGSVGYRPWLNGWSGAFTLPTLPSVPAVPSPDQPYGPLTSDPDVAVFQNVYVNAPWKMVCAKDALSRIACNLWTGSTFTQWFLQR